LRSEVSGQATTAEIAGQLLLYDRLSSFEMRDIIDQKLVTYMSSMLAVVKPRLSTRGVHVVFKTTASCQQVTGWHLNKSSPSSCGQHSHPTTTSSMIMPSPTVPITPMKTS
jgi:hypothetical protein